MLPLTGGTYNWSDFPDFQTLNASYPCQFIASSTGTTFTLKNINTAGRFLRGSLTAGTDQAYATALPTASFTTSTTGAHVHNIDPPNTTTTTNGNHTHTLRHSGEMDETQGYPAAGFNAVWSTDRTGGAASSGAVNAAGDHTHTVDIAAFNSASNGDHSHTVNGGGDAETRPINTSVIWCIKVKPTGTSGSLTINNTANQAINGLSVYGSAIGLGGSLNQSTTINQTSFPITFNSTATNGFSVDGTTFSVDAANDKIGVGTAAPSAKVHVLVPANTGNNNPAGNGIYVYNAGDNAGDNDDAIVGTRVLGPNSGDPFFSMDIDGITGWSVGIDNSDNDKLKFSNAWDDPGTNTRMSITTGGDVAVNNLAGTGNRDVYADANGVLKAGQNRKIAYVVDRPERTTDASNLGFRSIGASTTSLQVEAGDVIAVSVSFQFRWTGGSGTDQPKFGIIATGCGTISQTDTYEFQNSDNVKRDETFPISKNYVITATCSGTLVFNLYMDSNSNADDNAGTSDVVIIATKY